MPSIYNTAFIIGLIMITTLVTKAFGQEEKEYTPHIITAPDDVELSVQEWGNTEGPAILFIHGYSQTHMNWKKQVEDLKLTEGFRMITFDLRGHGMSDKPDSAVYYRDGERWAGDVAAIIDSLDIDNPVLVASSMGGRVVGDYITHHGDSEIAGVIFVGAILMDNPTRWFGPAAKFLEPMTSADAETTVDATIRFVESFFVTLPPEDEVRTMIAYNMMTPSHVRGALLGREADYEKHWRELNIPILLSHGVKDQVIDLEMSENAADLFEQAQTWYVNDIGHFPFMEAPELFNKELVEFVGKVSKE